MKIRKAGTSAAGTCVAVGVAVMLAMTAPVAAGAQYKPVPPPVWCGVVRFCPYVTGAA